MSKQYRPLKPMLISKPDNTQHWIVIAEHHAHVPYIKDKVETFMYGPFAKLESAEHWHKMLSDSCDVYIVPLIRPTGSPD